jgi:3-deoxy-D-manno-octulosonate 8-phosphate phosphatase KdsC-like HAD superfamily phosphatase
MYKLITPVEEGTLVQYLGVYALRWQPEWGEPQVAFVGDETVDMLQAEIKVLKSALEHAGKWIQQAEVSREPGWEGSTQHILNLITEALS